ncbi:hypothetical protein SLE2022_351530 [Rubroshorea leprosula]
MSLICTEQSPHSITNNTANHLAFFSSFSVPSSRKSRLQMAKKKPVEEKAEQEYTSRKKPRAEKKLSKKNKRAKKDLETYQVLYLYVLIFKLKIEHKNNSNEI